MGIAIAPKTVPSKTCINGTLFRPLSVLRWRSFELDSEFVLLPPRVGPGGGR